MARLDACKSVTRARAPLPSPKPIDSSCSIAVSTRSCFSRDTFRNGILYIVRLLE